MTVISKSCGTAGSPAVLFGRIEGWALKNGSSTFTI